MKQRHPTHGPAHSLVSNRERGVRGNPDTSESVSPVPLGRPVLERPRAHNVHNRRLGVLIGPAVFPDLLPTSVQSCVGGESGIRHQRESEWFYPLTHRQSYGLLSFVPSWARCINLSPCSALVGWPGALQCRRRKRNQPPHIASRQKHWRLYSITRTQWHEPLSFAA